MPRVGVASAGHRDAAIKSDQHEAVEPVSPLDYRRKRVVWASGGRRMARGVFEAIALCPTWSCDGATRYHARRMAACLGQIVAANRRRNVAAPEARRERRSARVPGRTCRSNYFNHHQATTKQVLVSLFARR